MANKAISELPQAENVQNQDLFVLEQSGIAKKLTAETFITEQGIIDALAEALDGHGGIQSVALSSVSGRIRTYLITFSDGSATTFQVYDGTSIERIEKTSTAGLVDTYTVFMSDGTTTFFQVTNGSKGDTGYPTDEQVTTAVTTWLDENVTPGTGVTLDRTLSMSNAAAPADLVGDLKSALNTITGTELVSGWVANSRINTNNDPVSFTPSAHASYDCIVVDCAEGDKFTLSGQNAIASYRLWCWCKDDGTIVEKPTKNLDYTNQTIVAPAQATKLVINSLNSVDHYIYKGEITQNAVKRLDQEDDIINKQFNLINSFNVLPFKDVEVATSNGITYSAVQGEYTVEGTSTNVWIYNIIGGTAKLPEELSVGETYFVSCPTHNALNLRITGVNEANPSGVTLFSTNSNGIFTVPSGYDGIIVRLHLLSGVTVPKTIVTPYIGKRAFEKITNGVENPMPLLTIIDDDGNSKFYTELVPLIASKGISLTSAVVVQRPDNPETYTNSMTWEQIEDAYQKGAEIVSHSYTHLTAEVAESKTFYEIFNDYSKAKNTLKQHGIDSGDILVYAGSSTDFLKVKKAGMLTYRCAFHAGGDEMAYKGGFNIFDIPRYRIEASYSYDIDAMKTLIDNCVANGGWMVWMIHTSAGGWNATTLQALTTAIDYAISKDLPIVSASDALKFYGT